MENKSKSLRFGILGAASIANKNVRAILQSKHCVFVGLASRSTEKANDFLSNLNLSSTVKIFSSYDELVNSNEIDAVYIPLPTTLHLEWSIKVAAAGKHILIEKPAAVNLTILKEIIHACRVNNVCFMDGVMFMHHPRMHMLSNLLCDTFTPPVSRIHTSFSFHGDKDFFESNIRANSNADCLGCLGDLGWYCARIGLMAINKSIHYMNDPKTIIMPKSCTAHCSKWSDDKIIPYDIHGRIIFDSIDPTHENKLNNTTREIIFDCSFLNAFRQKFEIICIKQTSSSPDDVGDVIFSCDDFVIPSQPHQVSLMMETFHPKGFPLVNYATRVMSQKQILTIPVPTPDLQQESAMFDTFAQLVYNKTNKCGVGKLLGGDNNSSNCNSSSSGNSSGSSGNGINTTPVATEAAWMHVALVTQAIIDACYVSMKSDGVETPIVDCFI